MFPVSAPAHPDQVNQISGHHTNTKEWSNVWGNHGVVRQDNLGYYLLESRQKHGGGIKGHSEREKAHKDCANTKTKV